MNETFQFIIGPFKILFFFFFFQYERVSLQGDASWKCVRKMLGEHVLVCIPLKVSLAESLPASISASSVLNSKIT